MTVSIVTYHTPIDELQTIFSCLTSPRISKVTVIDNASQPQVAEFCQAQQNKKGFNAKVEYIPSKNIGYGKAHNLSIAEALGREEYHLVVNSDVAFAPETLDRMLEYMDEHPEVALLHPRVLCLDGKDQYTVRMLPTPADLFVRRFLPKTLFCKSRDRYLLKHLDHNKPIDVAYVQGSFMLLRLSDVQKVGGFDPRFFMYAEDVDLSRRLAQVGAVRYWPGATITHKHRAQSYVSFKLLVIHAVNMAKYFNKWGWFVDKQRRETRDGRQETGDKRQEKLEKGTEKL